MAIALLRLEGHRHRTGCVRSPTVASGEPAIQPVRGGPKTNPNEVIDTNWRMRVSDAGGVVLVERGAGPTARLCAASRPKRCMTCDKSGPRALWASGRCVERPRVRGRTATQDRAGSPIEAIEADDDFQLGRDVPRFAKKRWPGKQSGTPPKQRPEEVTGASRHWADSACLSPRIAASCRGAETTSNGRATKSFAGYWVSEGPSSLAPRSSPGHMRGGTMHRNVMVPRIATGDAMEPGDRKPLRYESRLLRQRTANLTGVVSHTEPRRCAHSRCARLCLLLRAPIHQQQPAVCRVIVPKQRAKATVSPSTARAHMKGRAIDTIGYRGRHRKRPFNDWGSPARTDPVSRGIGPRLLYADGRLETAAANRGRRAVGPCRPVTSSARLRTRPVGFASTHRRLQNQSGKIGRMRLIKRAPIRTGSRTDGPKATECSKQAGQASCRAANGHSRSNADHGVGATPRNIP